MKSSAVYAFLALLVSSGASFAEGQKRTLDLTVVRQPQSYVDTRILVDTRPAIADPSSVETWKRGIVLPAVQEQSGSRTTTFGLRLGHGKALLVYKTEW